MYFNRRPFPRPTNLIVVRNREHAVQIKDAFSIDTQRTVFATVGMALTGYRWDRVIVAVKQTPEEAELFNKNVLTLMSPNAALYYIS